MGPTALFGSPARGGTNFFWGGDPSASAGLLAEGANSWRRKHRIVRQQSAWSSFVLAPMRLHLWGKGGKGGKGGEGYRE